MVKKLLPILFIFLVWFIFAKPFFIENKIPFPSDYQVNHFELWNTYEEFLGPVKNPAISDVVSQIYPWKSFTISTLKDFQIPFWNPYSFSGNPHLANYQSSVFSVTNIFYFIFDFKNAWSLSILIQPLLAGIFMYLFARSLKLRELSSTFSSISFMFCGIITTWMNWSTISLAISFLPLALFAIEKYYTDRKTAYLILLSCSFPLSFFSGHFQISLYFFIYIAAFIIFKFLEAKNKILFLETSAFSLLGILLSMPQILPSLEFYSNAFRSSVFQKINPVSINHLPTIIAPDFYGNPVSRNNFIDIYSEKSSFTGTIPFAISLYSVFMRNKKIYFFIFMAVASLLFCLDTPLLDLLIKAKVPVISTSSLSRILVLFSFSISILAGFGLSGLISDINNKKYKSFFIWSVIITLIISALWFLVLGKMIDPRFYSVALRNIVLPSLTIFSLLFLLSASYLNKKILTFGIIAILFLTTFDMLRFSIKWQPFASKENTFATTPIISELSNLDKNYRLIGPYGAEGSVYFGLGSTDGYDPLYINRYGEFIASLNDGQIKPPDRVGIKTPTKAVYFPKIIDHLGIKYILVKTRDLNEPWSFPLKSYPKEKFNLIYQDKDFQIYENREVYPRAYLVGDYEISNNDQEIIDKILNKNFDLRKKVALENNPNFEKTSNLVGDTEIISYSPNKIVINTKSDNESILVLTDNFYPGWKAKINNKKVDIMRANYTFRAVPVPKGESIVEFYYDSQTFKIGALLAILSLSSIFLVVAGKWYTKSTWNKQRKTVISVTKSSAKTANGKQIQKKQKK